MTGHEVVAAYAPGTMAPSAQNAFAIAAKAKRGASGWEDCILVARELLGDRPLDEFGVMKEIAETTIANYIARH